MSRQCFYCEQVFDSKQSLCEHLIVHSSTSVELQNLKDEKADRYFLLTEIIYKKPGIRFRELIRMSGFSNGIIAHYTAKLEKDGIIKIQRERKETRFYPSKISEDEIKIIQMLRKQTPRSILFEIIKNEKIEFPEIVKLIEKSASTISIYLKNLVNENIVKTKMENGKKLYYIKDEKLIKKIISVYNPT